MKKIPFPSNCLLLLYFPPLYLVFIFAPCSHQYHWFPLPPPGFFLSFSSLLSSPSQRPACPLASSIPRTLALVGDSPWRSLELSEGFCLGSCPCAGCRASEPSTQAGGEKGRRLGLGQVIFQQSLRSLNKRGTVPFCLGLLRGVSRA